MMKFHTIHRWRNSLPKKSLLALSPDQAVTWLFWEGSFSFAEQIPNGDELDRELAGFVSAHYPHPNWRNWRVRGEDLFHLSLVRFGNLGRRLRRICAGNSDVKPKLTDAKVL